MKIKLVVLMFMKNEQIKNTGQMVRRGQLEKLPKGKMRKIARGGVNGSNCQGGKGVNNLDKGTFPFGLIALVRTWVQFETSLLQFIPINAVSII